MLCCKRSPPTQIKKKLLVCGLDNSGKTTLVKKFNHSQTDEDSLVTTTPFINLDVITIPQTAEECLVYDLSGQVSN